MDKNLGKDLVEIKDQIKKDFTKSDWLELGYLLGEEETISNHPRLLRSLKFGDEDYDGVILTVLSKLVHKEAKNLDAIKLFLSQKYSTPVVSEFISSSFREMPKKLITFSPQVFSLPAKEQNKRLVAVMLPFKYSNTFNAIKECCDNLNLECLKADDIWNNSTFIQDIFDLIFIAEVIVADFTDKNPNVFYEVGIAHTLGKTVVPITQNLADVPSDLGHHRTLKYLANSEGYREMKTELSKRLKNLIPSSFDSEEL